MAIQLFFLWDLIGTFLYQVELKMKLNDFSTLHMKLIY